MSANEDYFVCPHCGAKLSADAGFCRACGASEEVGWGSDVIDDDGDDDFDYDEYVSREFPEHASPRPWSQQWRRGLWLALVILLCLALVALTVF